MFLAFDLKFLSVLFVLCILNSSQGMSPGDHVVLVAPVLAANNPGRARHAETAKEFPVLMLLATDENGGKVINTKVEGEPSPIYVQRLEDLKRHRRFSSLKIFK